ncbi:MAG: alpha-amylase family glycosyl hydrolase [Anaerolineaceae bacterium]
MKKHALFFILSVLIFSLTACQVQPSPTPAPTAVPPITEPAATETQSAELVLEQASTKWWDATTWYEIFVRSFKDSDGDGIGDFQGIISQLDYLNDGDPHTTTDLGITGIWLMPIMPSPSYHGYDITEYKDVNPDYGTMDDFKALLDACHERGIRVIIDFVVNHTSSDHPWFKAALRGDPTYKEYYVWQKEDPGTNGPWGQDPWHKGSNGEYYYGAFWGGMPDLNYHNPKVTEEVYAISDFWVKEVGVDGFRIDAARYLFEEDGVLQDSDSNIQWFKDWAKHLETIKPDIFTIGEVWAENAVIAKYADGEGMKALFAFDLAEDLKGSIFAPDPSRLIKSYNTTLETNALNSFGTFLSNHDQQRVASMIGNRVRKLKLASFAYLTGPGMPFIYYGEEIGMLGNKPDEFLRTPMQWSDAEYAGFSTGVPWEELNRDWKETNVETQNNDPESLLNWYRQLINLRNTHPALNSGDYASFSSDCRTLYATLRTKDDEVVLSVINVGNTEVKDCTITLDPGTMDQGTFQVKDLWGVSSLTEVTFTDADQTIALAPIIASGEAFVAQLTW